MQIDQFLSEREISAAQFAREIPVQKQTMYKYLKKIVFPSAQVQLRISELTGGRVTPNDWVERRTGVSIGATRRTHRFPAPTQEGG